MVLQKGEVIKKSQHIKCKFVDKYAKNKIPTTINKNAFLVFFLTSSLSLVEKLVYQSHAG